MPEQEQIEMVGECTSLYQVNDRGDDGIYIEIFVPRRFANLWMIKLTDLRATDEEIAEYGDECEDSSPPDKSR